MATTFTLISTITVGSGGAASIDFTSIPATYTDLCLKISARFSTAYTSDTMKISLNTLTTNFTYRQLAGNGSTAASYNGTFGNAGDSDADSATASTFSNMELYFPSYAGSQYKSWSADTVTENNATAAISLLIAGLWSNTAAITAIGLTPYSGGNFKIYSSASLYGILKA